MTTASAGTSGTARVYTDPRFEDLHILNDGSTRMQVIQTEAAQKPVVIERFRTLEKAGSASISEAFAAGRAAIFFNQLAAETLNGMSRRISESQGRDFADEQVLTADRVLDLWERAQAMPDGPEKDALMAQVRAGRVDESLLWRCEFLDDAFPEVDYTLFASGGQPALPDR